MSSKLFPNKFFFEIFPEFDFLLIFILFPENSKEFIESKCFEFELDEKSGDPLPLDSMRKIEITLSTRIDFNPSELKILLPDSWPVTYPA